MEEKGRGEWRKKYKIMASKHTGQTNEERKGNSWVGNCKKKAV